MGLFKKKDPIVEVEKALDHEVHEMEHDIQADVDAVMKKYDRESNTRIWEGAPKIALRVLMSAFSIYCILMTLFSKALPERRLSLFLGFIIIIGYLVYPARKGAARVNHVPWYDWILMVLGAGSFFYFAINAFSIIQLATKLQPIHIIVGAIGIVVLIELCRRCVGLPILVVLGLLLIYTFYNQLSWDPSFYKALKNIVYKLFYTTSGVIGTPVSVCYTYIVLFIIFGRVYDAFLMSMQRISEIIYEQFLAAAVSDFIMYIVIWLLSKHLPNILPGVAALVGQVIMASIWAYNAHHAYFKPFPPQATAVIYDTRRGMEQLIGKYGLDAKYKVVSTATAGEGIENLSMLDGINTVFLSGIHSHDRNIILKYCVENNITVFVVPRIGDTIMSGAHHMHMFHLPMLRVGRYNPQPEYLFIKRLLDIIISAAALVILSPIFLITAIAIKVTDHGPVFYKQIRLTKDGKEFGILKFRSMRVDAEKDGVARLSSGENDDRITPVGKIIRACRVDELPQLINILKGDLSIVGPRPERPEIAAQYCEEMPEFALRLQAKAGLTGYAQVYGKYNTTPYDKLTMDLMYIAHPSIVEDLKIMFATVKILFMPESTEGVSEGQTTAMSGESH